MLGGKRMTWLAPLPMQMDQSLEDHVVGGHFIFQTSTWSELLFGSGNSNVTGELLLARVGDPCAVMDINH
jgi:hypothetical protein